MNSNVFDQKKTKILKLFQERKFEEAIDAGKKLLSEKSSDDKLIFLLVSAYINIQKFDDAENYINMLLSFKQNDQIYNINGNIKKKLKKYNQAISSYEKAIELNPNFSEAYNNLGNTKKIINERAQAINCYKKAISLKADNIQALFNLSVIYKEDSNYHELINVYNKVLDLDKNNIKTLYNLGSAHLFLGNILKAKEYFKKVIEINELHIPSLRNYVRITKIGEKDKIFQHIKSINLATLNHEEKILITNALSKGYFDQVNLKLGFEYLSKSNSLKKEKSNFSILKEKKRFNDIKRFFSHTHNYNLKFDDQYLIKPIFILGMPRSGTTLLEQILSSHSKIHGAGELYYLQNKIDKLGLKKNIDITRYFLEIRNYYHQNISNTTIKPFIIDKFPVNFRWIGFIVNAFPEAKIIHIHRNPMAVCWSNYKTLFIDSVMDFSLSQEDVANYYVLYDNLMKFWSEKFKEKILNINYEDFVNDFETNTKKILKILNLDWEDQQKNYEKNLRAITTASFEQVRSKIQKDTSKQWKRFSDYLEPMQETLKINQIKF